MQKFVFTLEAETVEELLEKLENVKVSARYLTDATGQNPVQQLKDFKLTSRDKKQWTEFEINYLVENYKSKPVKWIAGRLARKPQGVFQMLNKMYKKGLPKKNNCAKLLN